MLNIVSVVDVHAWDEGDEQKLVVVFKVGFTTGVVFKVGFTTVNDSVLLDFAPMYLSDLCM